MNGSKFFDSEEAGLFYEHGLAIPSRTLYMGSMSYEKNDKSESGVDFRMAENVIKGLHILTNMDAINEITILMNNIGGDEYHGFAIYDAIKYSKAPVKIIVYGYAMSMGSVILQAAKKRVMTPNATMMVHMGSLDVGLDQRDITSFKGEWDRINMLTNEIYLGKIREHNPRYSPNQLNELLSTDRYLSAKQSVELGLADEVMTL